MPFNRHIWLQSRFPLPCLVSVTDKLSSANGLLSWCTTSKHTGENRKTNLEPFQFFLNFNHKICKEVIFLTEWRQKENHFFFFKECTTKCEHVIGAFVFRHQLLLFKILSLCVCVFLSKFPHQSFSLLLVFWNETHAIKSTACTWFQNLLTMYSKCRDQSCTKRVHAAVKGCTV